MDDFREDVLTLRDHFMKMSISNPGGLVSTEDVTASLSRILRKDQERRNDANEDST